MSLFDQIASSHGSPHPLGLSKTPNGWNLALYSAHASSVTVGLFEPTQTAPERTFPLIFSEADSIWHIGLKSVPEHALYAFQVSDSPAWLADPYAKILDTAPRWREPYPFPPVRAPFYTPEPFDWRGDKRPNIPKTDLVIYEMHVRGFTAHPSSNSKAPGTYRAIIDKIPHLKKLGVNAIELMPIHEFDELHVKSPDLPNYWGYQPISFFAPKRSYAKENALAEFKELVRAMHENGIEVILDVVYNHTGEGKQSDRTLSWRGIDNQTYYLVDREGHNRDFTGCGNTVNCNQPIVQQLILDSLRYWATEMRVDGFRFDLASILTRGPDAHPMDKPPLILAIGKDPILSPLKLIAEAWDASGLYQVGAFPKWGPWSDWNGRYRDIVRRFIKGTNGKAGRFAAALCGSDFLFTTPTSSINFVTAHDGYSLRDLVTFQEKHNLANGENNNDGASENDSWNCGAEGPTQDHAIQHLREKQMRNFLLALFLAQGIPMLLMGDEYGHTRRGNNNPYVQDNEINWFLWDQLQANQPIFDFVSSLIHFRHNHPELRRNRLLTPADIQWHGEQPNHPNWDLSSRLVAFTTHSLYACFNAHSHPVAVTLPGPCRLLVNTDLDWKSHHLASPGPHLPATLTLSPYSALLAQK